MAWYIYAPRLLLGDVNQTFSVADKCGGRGHNWRRVSPLWHMVDVCGFIDLGFIGPQHSWTNNREDVDSATIDRAWGNRLWRNRFPQAVVEHLPQVYSNHHPISVSCNGFCRSHASARPFQLELAWFSHPSFRDLVKQLGRRKQ